MTKPLSKLAQTRLTNAESAQFVTRFMDDLEKSGIRYNSDELIVSQLNQLKAQLSPMKKALEQVRASDKTVALAKADKARDEDYRALHDSLKPFRVSKREAEQAAYASLSLLLKQYKPTTGRNYEAQTILMVSLLEKLATAPYKEQVVTLGIKRFVDNLAESNTAFETLYAHRSKDQLVKVAYDTKALKNQLLFDYNLLVDYINVMAQLKKTKLYTDLIPVINNSRKAYSELLSRKTKTKKETKADD